MLRLMRSAWRRVAQARLPPLAAGLTLSSALSIVPLMVVGFALFERVPPLRPLRAAIEQHLLAGMLPDEISRAVVGALHRFAANGGSLTAVGALFVLAAALSMLHAVEGALDRMWDVRQPRPLPQRLGRYLLLLAVGPPLLGAALWAAVASWGAAGGLVRALPPPLDALPAIGPVVLYGAVLAALFRILPHAPVRWREALAGGVLGGLALELLKRAFGLWLAHAPTYRSLYGAFAALPVFLLWLYASWFVTLSAALVGASLGPRTARGRGMRTVGRSGARPRLARARA